MKITTHALILSFLFLLGFSSISFSQPAVDFQLKEMSKGSYPSLVITIPEATDKIAKKEWKTFMKNFDAKVKGSKPEKFKSLGVSLFAINGTDVVNVYADFEEKGDNLDAYIWFEAANQFVNSSSSESDIANAKAMVQNYYYNVRDRVVQEQVKDQEKKLRSAEKAQKKLEKDLTRYEKAIEKAKKAIAENEANIKQNAKDQKEALELIKNEEATLNEVKVKLNGVRNEGKN